MTNLLLIRDGADTHHAHSSSRRFETFQFAKALFPSASKFDLS